MWLLRQLRDAKARLRSSTYTICVETTKKSPKPKEKSYFQMLFPQYTKYKTPLKITFCICVQKLVDVRTVAFEKLMTKIG